MKTLFAFLAAWMLLSIPVSASVTRSHGPLGLANQANKKRKKAKKFKQAKKVKPAKWGAPKGH